MKELPFKFRLERVHSLRRQAERVAQEGLAASLGQREEGERSLREIEASIAAAREAARRDSGGAVDGAELRAADAYLTRLAGRRASAVHKLHQREEEVAERRRQLVAAARERQALDRLRARRRDEHRRAAARVEGEQLDELALAVHRRGERAA